MEVENLNTIIDRLNDGDNGIQQSALRMLQDMIKSSHSGSISTLSFQVFQDRKCDLLECCPRMAPNNVRLMYDMISAISIIGDEEDILYYRILGNVIPLKEWGHLYVKKLIGCIITSKEGKNKIKYNQTLEVAKACKEFLFANNMEVDAIDFLIEIEEIDEVVQYIDIHNYRRVIMYLEEMASFYDIDCVCSSGYIKMGDLSRHVVRMIDCGYDNEAIEFVEKVEDRNMKDQLLYILARLNIFYNPKDPRDKAIVCNTHIKNIYRSMIKMYELDLENTKGSFITKLRYDRDMKSMQQNSFSAITISNGFVNLGYGQDPIMFPSTVPKEGIDYQKILNSNIPELVTIMGSVGCVEFWNPAKVLEVLQGNIFGEPSVQKTGALLALALASCKSYDDNQTVLSLLTSNLYSNDTLHVIPTLLGIQSVYSGVGHDYLKDLLVPLLSSDNLEIAFFTAFTLGSIYVGTAESELISLFLQMYMEKDAHSDTCFFKFLMLGLALLYYRRQDVECCLEGLDVKFARHGSILVKGFQYIKSGDTEAIDHILSVAFAEDSDALLESIALLSSTLIGVGDELASQMITRLCNSALLLESPHLKAVLPLCLSMLYPSMPAAHVTNFLERNMSSGDVNISMASIYGLGIIGAGSVSGKIQKILDSQASQFYKDSKGNAILKISNGLLSLGKGLSCISICMYDKMCVVPKNLIGLFTTTFMMLEPFNSPLLNGHAYMFYLLNQSFTPKYIHTNEKINVRIGTPLTTVGLVGDPRRISSMQTHSTPVILNCTERAEVDEQCYTSFIEDVVILKNDK